MRRLLVSSLLILAAGCAGRTAAVPAWQPRLEAARTALAAGDRPAGLAALRDATAQAHESDASFATCAGMLAAVLADGDSSERAESERLFRAVIDRTAAGHDGADGPRLACRIGLGRLLLAAGRYTESAETLSAATMDTAASALTAVERADVHTAWAAAEAGRGRLAVARTTVAEAIRLRRAAGTGDPRALGMDLMQAAAWASESGDSGTVTAWQAARIHWEGISPAGAELASIHLALGEAALGAGSLIDAAGHLDRAERLLTTAVGRDHPHHVAVLDAQLRLHRANRQWQQARAAGDRMLDLLARSGGTDQQPYVAVLQLLVAIHAESGDLTQAMACNDRIIAIVARRFGPADPNLAAALHNGAGLARMAGDEQAAVAYLDRAGRIDGRRP